MFRTVPFRLNNVLSEGIELAFHAGAMLLQDFRKLPECGVVGAETCGLDQLIRQVNSQLVLPSVTHERLL
jgi:hypothetical protein